MLSLGKAFALPPVLFFSDITSGPNAGLNDGKGSGAIVTVWGANLGTSQGASTIQVGGVSAAYVYYWGNADGSKLAGPAVLYNPYQKIQTISFSIPSQAASGSSPITVTVGGVVSNILPFTVRAGSIYFTATNGNNSNPGTFAQPWLTAQYSMDQVWQHISPVGAIVYFMDGTGVASGGVAVSQSGVITGTAAAPLSFIAYPGASVKFTNTNNSAIAQWSRMSLSSYINFAKFSAFGENGAIDNNAGTRIVGNEMTQAPGTCSLSGQGAAISGPGNAATPMPASGDVILGNYIHDWGCSTTPKLEHTFYMSNRTGSAIDPYESGWNYLLNNQALHGLHTYDEGICGGYTGATKIHDNAVINQVGSAVDVGGACNSGIGYAGDFYIYNNLFVNVAHDNAVSGTQGAHCEAFSFIGTVAGTMYVYNNTLYGYGNTDASNPGAPCGHALLSGNFFSSDHFSGQIFFKNNIVVDTLNFPFYYQCPACGGATGSNNIWYSSFGQAAPTWDTNHITSNPQFVNPVLVPNPPAAPGNFQLSGNSPVSPGIDAGTNLSPTVTRDILGALRPQGGGFDIGAYEFTGGVTLTSPPAPPRGFWLH